MTSPRLPARDPDRATERATATVPEVGEVPEVPEQPRGEIAATLTRPAYDRREDRRT